MNGETTVKHTCGPWTYHKLVESYVVTTDRNHPADIRDVANVPDIHVGETEANARLIAAAPELLAACQRLLDRFMVVTPDGYSDPGGDITAARAAIRKAKGEHS